MEKADKNKIIEEILRYDDLTLDKEKKLKDLSIFLADTHNKLQNEFDKIEQIKIENEKAELLIKKREKQYDLENKNIKYLNSQISILSTLYIYSKINKNEITG
mmetsp:Transcript_21320/g.18926  ORF Transcript_21320/g.18926 Transcript_21320/m.18926 type:complete len:103 (+) Transcript_21320:31-339(+)